MSVLTVEERVDRAESTYARWRLVPVRQLALVAILTAWAAAELSAQNNNNPHL